MKATEAIEKLRDALALAESNYRINVVKDGEPSGQLENMQRVLAATAQIEAPTSEAVADKRRCPACNATRGGTHCWKCQTETFEPSPMCGDDPRLPPIDCIRELAKEVGYAIGVHGSQQRDLDVIAAPWSDSAVGNHALLEHIANGLTTDNGPARIVEVERKPLGRYAATIQMDGWYKQLDISVCPSLDAAPVLAAVGENQPRDIYAELMGGFDALEAQQVVGVEKPQQGEAHRIMLASGFVAEYDKARGVHTYTGHIEDAELALAGRAQQGNAIRPSAEPAGQHSASVVTTRNFDHLAGRGMHELRHDELREYLVSLGCGYGPSSDEFVAAADWVVGELDRKTNDERVLAVQLLRLREAATAEQSAPAGSACQGGNTSDKATEVTPAPADAGTGHACPKDTPYGPAVCTSCVEADAGIPISDEREGFDAWFAEAYVQQKVYGADEEVAWIGWQARGQQQAGVPEGCTCATCVPNSPYMILCATCGNKRCPHAKDHRNACTNSNEPGQVGSSYENCGFPAHLFQGRRE